MGPRALGNRSILASPLRREIRDLINARIKYREPFRPFAPAVLAEYAADVFRDKSAGPFHDARAARSARQGRRHSGGRPCRRDRDASRPSSGSRNPRYYGVIEEFMKLTGVPVLLNTSFNKQEPIVARPEEAISCFLRTEIDTLVLGNFYTRDRPAEAVARARDAFTLMEVNTRGGE